jgi:adenylate cyclase class IV
VNASKSSHESEIKIPVPDLAAVRARLADAERISERHDESNVLFDDAKGSLRKGRPRSRAR